VNSDANSWNVRDIHMPDTLDRVMDFHGPKVSGTGTGGRVDPGCWSSDYILVREYTPFGSVYLPGVTR
jgi:hypothetical protein